jgi:hypothetical protein
MLAILVLSVLVNILIMGGEVLFTYTVSAS